MATQREHDAYNSAFADWDEVAEKYKAEGIRVLTTPGATSRLPELGAELDRTHKLMMAAAQPLMTWKP